MLPSLSHVEPGRAPANSPMPMPSRDAKAMATTPSCRVAGNGLRAISKLGDFCHQLSPKSKNAALEMNSQYCTKIGLSKPIWRRNSSTASGGVEAGSITRTGSPRRKFVKKTTVTTPKISSAECPSRCIASLYMPLPRDEKKQARSDLLAYGRFVVNRSCGFGLHEVSRQHMV